MNIEGLTIGFDMTGGRGGAGKDSAPPTEGGRFELFPISPFAASEAFKAIRPVLLDERKSSFVAVERFHRKNHPLLAHTTIKEQFFAPNAPGMFILGGLAMHEAIRIEAERRGKKLPSLSEEEVASFNMTLEDPETLGTSVYDIRKQLEDLRSSGLSRKQIFEQVARRFGNAGLRAADFMQAKMLEILREFSEAEDAFNDEYIELIPVKAQKVPEDVMIRETLAFLKGAAYVRGVFINARDVDRIRAILQ